MSAPHQQPRHSICHVGGFCQWVDGNDQNRIDFLFLGMTLVTKSILGSKWELTQQPGHSICHVGGFRQWVDGNDQNRIDFIFLGMTLVTKSILGSKWELTQNIGTKSTFLPKFYVQHFKTSNFPVNSYVFSKIFRL